MANPSPRRVVAPHPRSLDQVLGRNLPQWAVDFVVIDLERDLELGIFLTLKLAANNPSIHVRRMYSTTSEFFRLVHELMLKGDQISLRRAYALLTFPEPHEIRLGYTQMGSYGSGIGEGELRDHLYGVLVANPELRRGLIREPDLIQTIPWIAMDRSSDVIATIAKTHLIAFTQEQAAFWRFDPAAMRSMVVENCWIRGSSKLDTVTDTVPVDDLGRAFILVPKEICRSGPAITPTQYFRDIGPGGTQVLAGTTLKEKMLSHAGAHPGILGNWAADRLKDPSRFKPRKEFRPQKNVR